MSSERKPEQPASKPAKQTGHGRFAQALQRFGSRSSPNASASPPKGPPPRTASAGTRRPAARSAAAVPPAKPAPRKRPPAAKAVPVAAEQAIPPAELIPPPDVSVQPSTPPARPTKPAASRAKPSLPTQTWVLNWRWTPLIIGVAVLCWIVALSLLFTGSSPMAPRLQSPRLTFVVVWVIASLMTFVPLEYRLGLPGLSVQGVVGWTFFGYLLAFAPAPAGPPAGWLFDLPDLPVYLLFFLALFYAVSAAALPLVVIGGRRIWTQRLYQLDVRRARRQAYELGILMVGLMVLAALRALSPLTGLLFVAVIVLVEMLLLSQVAPEG